MPKLFYARMCRNQCSNQASSVSLRLIGISIVLFSLLNPPLLYAADISDDANALMQHVDKLWRSD